MSPSTRKLIKVGLLSVLFPAVHSVPRKKNSALNSKAGERGRNLGGDGDLLEREAL